MSESESCRSACTGPFAADRLIAALPSSVRAIAVLDRTKEPGSAGEPLYQDVVTAIHEAGLSTRSGRRPLRPVVQRVHASRW